jgi:hypothetical protein
MIQNNKLSQLARRITKTDTVLRDPQLFHPTREWRIGLIVAIFIFIASAIWSMQTYIFFRDSSAVQEVSPVEEVTVYRESLVEAALTAYKERAEAHTLLLQKVQIIPTTAVATETPQTEEQNTVEQTEDEQSIPDNPLLETEIASTTEGGIE